MTTLRIKSADLIELLNRDEKIKRIALSMIEDEESVYVMTDGDHACFSTLDAIEEHEEDASEWTEICFGEEEWIENLIGYLRSF